VSYIQKGRKISIMMDTSYFKEIEKIVEDSDLLISEATYSKELEEKASEYNHMTAEQAATIAKNAKVKRLILTHLSQRYESDDTIIGKEAKKIFKNSEVAQDLMQMKI
ncbi:MAG: MBL fold metallo-hydrolase, partial [Candidatus Pacebacteria bacterium]|nr:MBL fold metallo-hydrolase [Candidatus Paceibacterota bacterium]